MSNSEFHPWDMRNLTAMNYVIQQKRSTLKSTLNNPAFSDAYRTQLREEIKDLEKQIGDNCVRLINLPKEI